MRLNGNRSRIQGSGFDGHGNVVPLNAEIQSFQMNMDFGCRIWSGTGFAGVTGIETFCGFVNLEK